MGLSRSRAGAVLVAALLAVSLVACGGEDEPDTKPSETPSSSAPSAEPSPTKSEPPLSKFENKPQVRVLRTWATRAARNVNAGKMGLEGIRGLVTEQGMTTTRQSFAEDRGLVYPGPLPFAPTRVTANGDTATVVACVLASGFAENRKTKKPASARAVIPVQFDLRREAKRWKLDRVADGTGNCRGVKVKTMGWQG